MMTSKSTQLSITLKSVELIKELSLGLAPIGCIAVRHFCNEISRTLINQAGEIDSLTASAQKLVSAPNSYEVHWDSLIFAIMGADAKADIIDSVDIERTTTAAIAAVNKLASQRDEKQRVAEAFQRCAGIGLQSIPRIHELKIAPEYLEAVICGQKKAETRINDRDFKVNDRLILREWENDAYTGCVHEVVITHICDFPYVITGDKWVSLSISPAYALAPDALSRYLNRLTNAASEVTQ